MFQPQLGLYYFHPITFLPELTPKIVFLKKKKWNENLQCVTDLVTAWMLRGTDYNGSYFHIISCEIRYFQSMGPAVFSRSPIEVLSAHNVPRNFLDGTRYLFDLLLQQFLLDLKRREEFTWISFSCNKVQVDLILRSK